MNTFLDSTNILGVRVTASPKGEILKEIQRYLLQSQKSKVKSQKLIDKPLVIVTPNPEQIVLAQKDTEFSKILNSADVALPDGYGILLAAKFLNIQYPISNIQGKMQRIPGVEFMEDLVGLAARNSWPVALVGGRGGAAEEALERLKKKYPGLVGWAEEPEEIINTTPAKRDPRCCNPNKNWEQHRDNTTNEKYYQYIQDSIEKIRKTKTKVVFVGLGAPKQEYFVARLASQDTLLRTQESVLLMSVGGSFDIIAGRARRAPHAIQAVHLEWLWRLILEPWRWKRQMALLKFLWLVVCRKLALKGLAF